MPNPILIVDDEPSIRKVVAAQLKRAGLTTIQASDGAEAIDRLCQEPVRLVITDLRMPNMDGLALLAWVAEHRPNIPVIMITAHGTVDTAVEALKQGAFDYITKPFDQTELLTTIEKGLGMSKVQQARSPSLQGTYGLVGETKPMRDLYTLIGKVAPSPTTVLVTGESGTGKELVARALHNESNRADGPFVQINCGAIPENLFEAELFGYEKGAFTGASQAKIGRFELANKGTLLLDEVGDLPLAVQVKLLRALQERTIDRVGGLRPIPIDVRVVAATNVDLREAVEQGTFRDDLYWRLNVMVLPLPPLRERRQDVSLLVDAFIRRFNERLGRNIVGISDGAQALLESHDWPGNIRELENVMERTILLAEGDTIAASDLPPLSSKRDPVTSGEELGLKEYVKTELIRLERAKIQQALGREEGNVTRAAKRLGISRKSLQVKMKDYGLRE